jgi:hypothetical protein
MNDICEINLVLEHRAAPYVHSISPFQGLPDKRTEPRTERRNESYIEFLLLVT